MNADTHRYENKSIWRVTTALLLSAASVACIAGAEETRDMATKVKREGGKVWIEGVPELHWGKGTECTYAGAVAAALAVTEHPVPYEDIVGFSGLAFRLRWWFSDTERGKRGWCPSTPVGEFPEEVEASQERTGWRFLIDSRMDREKDPHMEDRAKDIAVSIEAGKPVPAYVSSQNLNVGVIYGYQDGGKKWLMRDYFAKDGTTVVPIEKLGPMIFILREFKPTMPRREAVEESLKMAVKHWTRGKSPNGKYLYGKAALEQWAKDLSLPDDATADLSSQEKGALFFATWWVFSQWHDAREAAVKFLDMAAEKAEGKAGEALKRAKKLYEGEVKLLVSSGQGRDAFLGPWNAGKVENWTPELRKREQEILAAAARLEAAAVAEIEKAVEPNR